MNNWEILPDEIIVEILSYCCPPITRQVCSLFRACSGKVNIFAAVSSALREKYFSLLPYLVAENNKELVYNSLNYMAQEADLETIKWARGMGCVWDERTPAYALKGGKTETFYWLKENGCPWGPDTLTQALLMHPDIFRWAYERGCPWDIHTFTLAAERGDVETAQKIIPTRCMTNKPFAKALKKGNWKMVEFLLEKKFYLEEEACAVSSRDLRVLVQLRLRGAHWNSTTCARAAKRGDLDTLKWLRTYGCPWDEWTCANAAQNGHLDIIRWARDQGCRWGEMTMNNAALGGHVRVMEWARENGCQWSESTCAFAARGGKLDALRWLREKGCPWDSRVCSYAADEGYSSVLEWAIANGCPLNSMASVAAAKCGNELLLRWVLANGGKANSSTAYHAMGNKRLFQWLVTEGCPLSRFVWEEIVKRGDLPLLRWLMARLDPPTNVIDAAARYGQLDVLKWCLDVSLVTPLPRPYTKKITSYTCSYAAEAGHLYVLKYLRMKGVRLNAHVISFAARSGRLDVIKWARDHGCPMNKRACSFASKEGHLDSLVWLRANGCPWDKRVYDYAVRNGRWNVVAWLNTQDLSSWRD